MAQTWLSNFVPCILSSKKGGSQNWSASYKIWHLVIYFLRIWFNYFSWQSLNHPMHHPARKNCYNEDFPTWERKGLGKLLLLHWWPFKPFKLWRFRAHELGRGRGASNCPAVFFCLSGLRGGCVTSLVELVVQWPCPVPCCPSCQSQRLRIPTGKVATALSVCHNLFGRISQRCRI